MVVGHGPGVTPAGRNLGRFADLLAPADRAAAAEAGRVARPSRPDLVVAELVYLPRGCARPTWSSGPPSRSSSEPSAPAPASPPSGRVPLDELVVGIGGSRLRLWWPARGAEVEVTAGHMLNPAEAPAVCRFWPSWLDGRAQLGGFSWGPAAGFLFSSRVQAGRVVLRPASWRLDPKAGPGGLGRGEGGRPPGQAAVLPPGDGAAALRRWREDWRLGGCSWAAATNGCCSTWTTPPRPARSATSWAGPAGGPARGPSWPEEVLAARPGRAVPVRAGGTAGPRPQTGRARRPAGPADGAASPGPLRSRPEPGPRAERPGRPGATGCTPSCMAPARTRTSCWPAPSGAGRGAVRDGFAASGWFFLRHGDPDPHLRLRFRGAPERLTGELLHGCAPGRARWSPPEPVTGSPSTPTSGSWSATAAGRVAAAEELFAADSGCVAALLGDIRGLALDRTAPAGNTRQDDLLDASA